jgi:hypothetical protein
MITSRKLGVTLKNYFLSIKVVLKLQKTYLIKFKIK